MYIMCNKWKWNYGNQQIKLKVTLLRLFFYFFFFLVCLSTHFVWACPPLPNTYKNRFELLSCKITTTNLQKMAIFEKLLVKNSFFIIEVFFFSSRERIISNICVWLHVCMDIIFMLPICMYKHRGHGHPCLRRGTAKDAAICTLVPSFVFGKNLSSRFWF